MSKLKKTITCLLTLTLFFTLTISNASAYSLLGGRHPGTVAPYKWGTFTSEPGKWRDAFLNANYSWNYATSDVQWGYDESNTYSIEQVYYLENSTEYGRFQGKYNTTTKYWTLAWSELNQFALETVGVEKSATFKQSTACHEEGHSLGLGHSTATCIMNTSRDRETIYEPKSDDITGVNSIY